MSVIKTDYGFIRNDGHRLTSVTKFVAQYHKPFDPIAVAESLSKKTGLTPEHYLNEWRESADNGIMVHKQIENSLINGTNEYEYIDKIKECILIALANAGLKNGLQEVERIAFNEKYDLAGIADYVIFNKHEKKFITADFKTTKKLRMIGYRGEKMLEPFSTLDDCNYNHYQLQLNAYALMIEIETGYKCVGRYIIHANGADSEIHGCDNLSQILLRELEAINGYQD